MRFHHRAPSSRRALLFGVRVVEHRQLHPADTTSSTKRSEHCLAIMALSPTEMYQVNMSAEPSFFEGAPASAELSWAGERGRRGGERTSICSVGSCIFGYWTVPSTAEEDSSDSEIHAAASSEDPELPRPRQFCLISMRKSAGSGSKRQCDDAWSSRPNLPARGVFSAWDATGSLFSETTTSGRVGWGDRYAALHAWIQIARNRRRAGDLRVVLNPCTPFSLLAPWVRRARASGALRHNTPVRLCIFSAPQGVRGTLYHWNNTAHIRLRCMSAHGPPAGGTRELQSRLRVQSEDGVSLDQLMTRAGAMHRGLSHSDPGVRIAGIGARAFRCGAPGRVCNFQLHWKCRPDGEEGSRASSPLLTLRLVHAPIFAPGLRVRAMGAAAFVEELRSMLGQVSFQKLYALSESKQSSASRWVVTQRRRTSRAPSSVGSTSTATLEKKRPGASREAARLEPRPKPRPPPRPQQPASRKRTRAAAASLDAETDRDARAKTGPARPPQRRRSARLRQMTLNGQEEKESFGRSKVARTGSTARLPPQTRGSDG